MGCLTCLSTGHVDLRGLMLYEQVAPLSLILQQDFDQGKIDKQEFVEGLR
jgi:hypothetical protein